ncbi:MAG: sigma-54-dependent Fis family transcriptional regulator [Gemmatimonadetes bacterium]|nr:sigma-54-dependent Fis family transcriptional regulator [Gemmatimonadota bacterium]
MPRSVLLIDDDTAVLQLLTRFFTQKQWEVASALTAEEGVRHYEVGRPDLVLLDLNLPGLSGMHALELLVAHGATVVMLTGHGEIDTAVEAMQLGAESFLTKPVSLTQLEATAERAVEKVELRRTNRLLAQRLAERSSAENLGVSPKMQELARQVERVAASGQTTVLLLGASGTGKSMIAEMVHAQSPRARHPFVEISCASLSGAFLASELFGHERGAFTDAREMKRGLFEVADGGTLFMDEIGDLAADLQPKLLKVLESRSFRRLGATREIKVDVRLVAATNKDLFAEVKAGRFREDLYYRLSTFPLTIPTVRERSRDDVLALVQRLLERLRSRHPQAPREIAPRALDLLVGYGWPGNVREMHNVLERALVLAGGGERIEAEHLSPALHSTGGARRPERFEQVIVPLEEVERQHIERALYLTSGNRSAAAERLGISRATLHNKIKIYGLQTVGRQ